MQSINKDKEVADVKQRKEHSLGYCSQENEEP